MQDLQIAINTLLDNFEEIEYISLIKTGKEAEVHLIKVDNNLSALKIYKQNQKYSTQTEYFGLNEIGDSRAARAIKNKTTAGRRIMSRSWAAREYEILEKLYSLNAHVPQPLYCGENFILMEYLGNLEKKADRLSEVNLTKSQAQKFFTQIIDHVYLFISQGFIHGDLSEFNILIFQDQIYIIDFPQIVFIRQNPNAKQKFFSDIDNIKNYFKKYNLDNFESELRDVVNYFWENF